MTLLVTKRSAGRATSRSARYELPPELASALVPEQRHARAAGGVTVEERDDRGRRALHLPRVRRLRAEHAYVAQLVLIDALAAATGALLALVLSRGPGAPAAALVVTACLPMLWVSGLAISRAYEPRFLYAGAEEFRRVLGTATVLVAGAALLVPVPRTYLLVLVVVTLGGSEGGRYVRRAVLIRQRKGGAGWMRRVVVAGHQEAVLGVVSELRRSRSHGYDVAAVCLAEQVSPTVCGVPLVAGLGEVSEVAAKVRADTVIVLPSHQLDGEALRRLGWQLERSRVQLCVAPPLLDVARHRATVSSVGGVALVHVDHAELAGVRRVVKEVFDRAVAALALVVMAPVLGLLLLAIRLDSPGPAIFRQERVGRDHRSFTVLKLRTMATDAEHRLSALVERNESDGVLFKMRDDPRVTRLGHFLRRYSLDELPQLVNVVLGHMSLVGPRPALPSEVNVYESHVHRRLAVKPGMTGLWQVSGRSNLAWEESVRLDLRYVENWSLTLDLAILWRTWRAVIAHEGAC